MKNSKRILALCGGVGGAKLAYGLAKILSEDELTILVNTGDDFEYLDLTICPDIDTVSYTLSDINNTKKGWGIRNESWNTLKFLTKYGAENWFQLGDKDLAVHLYRTFLLKKGMKLSEVTKLITERLKIKHNIVPMSETPVRTILYTDKGIFSFQEYFVKHKCKPVVKRIEYSGSKEAVIPKVLKDKLKINYFNGVIICPSNPYLSIDPILSIKSIKDFLIKRTFPVLAVSPFINNQAIKGPSAKIARELNDKPTNKSIINHYQGILDRLVVNYRDYKESEYLGIKTLKTTTLMHNNKDKKELAKFCLNNLD